MIDTHAHLDFEQFQGDLDLVLERAKKAGVQKIINVGSSLEGSKKSIELSNNYSFIFNTIGLHPHEAEKFPDFKSAISQLEGLKDKKTVAIGEIGLDYFGTVDEAMKKRQKELLIRQLDLAEKLNLPVVLHCREAYSDLIALLADHPIEKGVIHCFVGDWSCAEKFLANGLSLSFTGIVTYPKADQVRDVAGRVPLEKIMVETDCPYLSPQVFRGERNEPAYVVETAKKISEIKGLPLSEVEGVTDKNANEFFAI